MSSPPGDEEEPSPYRPFTKAERIQQLNDIDKSITQLLQTTALALKTLSASQSETAPSPSDRRKAFENASDSFLGTLHKVDVGIRRQIMGLEEADIIAPEKIRRAERADGKPIGGTRFGPPEGDSGIGKLDIGWLNSRSGRVGRDMEAELWQKTKGFLEDLEPGKNKEATRDEDTEMT